MISFHMFTYRGSLSSAEVQVQILDFEVEGGRKSCAFGSSFKLVSIVFLNIGLCVTKCCTCVWQPKIQSQMRLLKIFKFRIFSSSLYKDYDENCSFTGLINVVLPLPVYVFPWDITLVWISAQMEQSDLTVCCFSLALRLFLLLL